MHVKLHIPHANQSLSSEARMFMSKKGLRPDRTLTFVVSPIPEITLKEKIRKGKKIR